MQDDPYKHPELLKLVSRALELSDSGEPVSIEELCADRPELIEAVTKSLETCQRIPALRRASVSQDSRAGRVLDDRYRLIGRLGAGAMGIVYLADDLVLGRQVAVKILRPLLLEGKDSELRFQREADVLAGIRHPAVVQIFDRGRTSDDDPYLVMELLEGVSVGELMEDGIIPEGTPGGVHVERRGTATLAEPSPIRDVVRWSAELAAGLTAVHAAGIQHRDVKPSNVFLRDDGHPVLLDFGLATGTDHNALTRSDSTLGTPAYMAPEVLQRGATPSPKLDVYGLTATLYHMLTLRPPYRGSPSQILVQLSKQRPRVARHLRPAIPNDLQAILDRGMARDPAERYESAAELEADLRAFLDYRPVKARSLGRLARAWRWFRSSMPARAAVGGVSATTLLVVLWFARSAWAERQSTKHFEIWRQLPPSLNVMTPQNRALTQVEGKERIGQLLNQAVDLAVDVLPSRLYRVFFRLDHGNTQGAIEDIEAIASKLRTPYSQELAERYRDLRSVTPADVVPTVKLDNMPQPTEAEDFYLAGYHAFRHSDYAQALNYLNDETAQSFPPVRELASYFRMTDPVRLYADALALEAHYGGRTATTAHFAGLSMILRQEYAKALESIQDGLKLAPHCTSLLRNGSLAAKRLGEWATAEQLIRSAIASKPHYVKPHIDLVLLLIESGETERAQQTLEGATFADAEVPELDQLVLQGEVEAARAIQLWEQGDVPAAREAAGAAVLNIDAARRLGKVKPSQSITLARAMQEGDEHALLAAMVELIRTDPLHTIRLRRLPDWVPDSPTKADTALIVSLFGEIADKIRSVRLAEKATNAAE